MRSCGQVEFSKTWWTGATRDRASVLRSPLMRGRLFAKNTHRVFCNAQPSTGKFLYARPSGPFLRKKGGVLAKIKVLLKRLPDLIWNTLLEKETDYLQFNLKKMKKLNKLQINSEKLIISVRLNLLSESKPLIIMTFKYRSPRWGSLFCFWLISTNRLSLAGLKKAKLRRSELFVEINTLII